MRRPLQGARRRPCGSNAMKTARARDLETHLTGAGEFPLRPERVPRSPALHPLSGEPWPALDGFRRGLYSSMQGEKPSNAGGRRAVEATAGDERCWTPAPPPAAKAPYIARGHERHRPGVRLGRARATGWI